MKPWFKILVLAALASLSAAPEASAQFWKRKPPPNPNAPINIDGVREAEKDDLTHVSRKKMIAAARAAVKRGEASMETARGNLDAANRSEMSNRKLRLAAKGRLEAAKLAYQANPTQQNKDAANQALADYMPVRQQHEAALSMRNATQRRLSQLRQFQAQAVGSLQTAEALKPSTPEQVAVRRAKQPRFNRSTQFGVPAPGVYERVPAGMSIYGPGPPGTRAEGNQYTPGPARPAAVQNANYAQPGDRLAF